MCGLRGRDEQNFRGIRQLLNYHPNPVYCFTGCETIMDDPQWRRGYALLEKYGLSFDMHVCVLAHVSASLAYRRWFCSFVAHWFASMLEFFVDVGGGRFIRTSSIARCRWPAPIRAP